MEITISQEIASRLDIRDTVGRANDVLKATIGRAPHPPKAVWKLNESSDPAKPIALNLEYFDQSLSALFSLEELTDVDNLFYRLLRIWGRLIIQNNRADTQRIVETLGELREDLREPQQA
jgi:hypothetical protein